MYLEYGINEHGELVHINAAQRGKTELHCPYCNGLLLARKGEILAHHFAHAGETCRAVERDPDAIALPAYDNFHLHLPGRAVEHLRNFAAGTDGYDEHYLGKFELVAFNEFAGRRGNWELTKKGKLVLGDLSLMLFNEFQEPLITARHDELHERVKLAYEKPAAEARRAELQPKWQAVYNEVESIRKTQGYTATFEKQKELAALAAQLASIPRYDSVGDLDTALIDLRLYRAQWRRILTCSLYFLQVQHSAGTLHKIGVTTRDINERVAEVQRDLSGVLGNVQIDVIDVWPHRGNVELYFKHRYKAFNNPLGILTEYYLFPDVKAVLRDLRRMKSKELTDFERLVMTGESAPIEETIRLDQVEARRRSGIRQGMQRAAQRGKHIGRPGESPDDFMNKPEIIKVREALASGMSLREAARVSGVAVNTVRKVKAMI